MSEATKIGELVIAWSGGKKEKEQKNPKFVLDGDVGVIFHVATVAATATLNVAGFMMDSFAVLEEGG
jgi:hypothetical protein